jgi:peptidoglycan/xylan/chitin deacetylase (PgdA/CDA1 family)
MSHQAIKFVKRIHSLPTLMENPLNAIGYKLLTSALESDVTQQNEAAKLSRRGFLLAAAALTGCATAKPMMAQPKAAAVTPVKTPSNTAYRTPTVLGPVPRNPDMQLSNDISHLKGITFSHVHVVGQYIAMTFDDGPHPQNTPRLLDMLRARNIKATFYVIGQSVNLHPQIVRRTLEEGHEIGNHSNTHRQLSKLSDSEIIADLGRCESAVISATGTKPLTLRPPYGALLPKQRELVYEHFGYPIILWSVDPLDWKRPGPSVVSSRILAGAKPGGIILSHDLHGQTVDAMPATLDTLLRRGYKFVTVSQLLAMQVEVPLAPTTAVPANS